MNAIKDSIKSGRTVVGTTAGPNVDVSILAEAGYDFVLFDTQHSPWEIKQLQPSIQTMRGKPAAPLVRVAANQAYQICFALDAGARGIVVPMVNTRAEAEAAVHSCRYYPLGNRSNAGVRGEWGEFKNYRDYLDTVNSELVIVPMIETNQSLENLDAIASVPGVDLLLIGPSDLSIDLGVPLDYQFDIYQRALDKIAATAAKHVVPARSILNAANVPIIGGHHVLALQSSPEGWQATPLLERCREHAGCPGARGAAARAVSGRDQRHPGVGVAAVDRGARGRLPTTADAVAVSGRPRRRSAGGRLDRPRQAVAVAVAPAAAVGRRLVGAAAVAELQLDQFWSKRLGVSRKGTRWDQVLFVLVAYRLLAPGSEWRLHREWFQRSALADLLGEDAGLAEIHKLYRCHDRLLQHKQAVFDHLTRRWRDLYNISYDVLLYDLTSTYFEADPPFPEGDKRRFGYSRDPPLQEDKLRARPCGQACRR